MPICKLSTDNVKPQSDEKKPDMKQPRGSIDVDIDPSGNNGASCMNNHLNGGLNNNNVEWASYNIQLEPQSLAAFSRVQRLAQNPFLSIDVAPEQTIKFLIQFLENKWKSRRTQFLELFNIDSKNDSEDSTCQITSNNTADKLVLYLNETHLAVCQPIQKAELVKSEETVAYQTSSTTNTEGPAIIKPGSSAMNNENSFLMSSDEVTMVSNTNNIDQMNCKLLANSQI